MGATMSKSISRRSVSWLESKMEQLHQQMDADIARDIAEKQANAGPGGFTDPSARDAGFTRGFGPQLKSDIMQTHFLQQKAKESGREGVEMDPELVKFLQDMGPLERKVDEQFTSKRLLKEGELIDRVERRDKHRTIRDMPLMGEAMDHTTKRTTNFGTAVKIEDDDDFGCRDWQLYEMLKRRDTMDASTFWTNIHKAPNVSDELRLQQIQQLQNTLYFIDLPIVMRDKKDKTYLGIWPQSLDELRSDEEMGHLYETVGEDRIKLCVDDFRAIDEKEDAKNLVKG